MTGAVESLASPDTRAPLYRRAADGQVDTADLPRILWHRRYGIGGLACLLGALALAYSLLTPWLYTATSQILIDPRDKVVVSNDINPSAMAPDGGVAQVESQVRVIESTSVLLRAVKALGLADDPEFGAARPGIMNRIGRLLHGRSAADVPPAEAATQRALVALRKKLAVKRADKVFVIDITATARSPDKAARIANAIAQAFLDDQAAARTQSAIGASDGLAARLAEQKRQVNQAETAVERYKAEHALLPAANGILLTDQQLTDITTQLEAARTKASEARVRFDQIAVAFRSNTRADGTAEALQSTVITQLRARKAAIQDQRAQLSVQVGPRYPALAEANAQIREVDRLINNELGRILLAAEADGERAQANLTLLQDRLAAVTTKSLATKQAAVRLRELERDLDASRTVYSAFLLRAQETREQASIDSSNARIITQAMPPNEHSWPLLGFLVLGGLGGGFGLGAAGAFAAAYVAPVILSSAQLRRALNLPVTVVPLPRRRRFRVWRRKGPAVAAPPAALDDVALDFVLRRVIESGLQKSGTNRIFSVVCTSGRDDLDRDAQLAETLAAAAASLGDRVLLVDAASAKADTQPGLLDVLRGDASLERSVRRGAASGITTLGTGTQRPRGADLRAARSADRLLSQAARQFDIMVVHGGAAAENLRVAPLVAAADEILVVAESGRTAQRDVVKAVEALLAFGRKPTQAVLIENRARG